MKRKKIVSKKSDVTDRNSYAKLVEQLKTDIQQTQVRAALSITKELIMLYWRTGKLLSMKIDDEGWGAKILEKLARVIRNEFPDITGFSLRNMHYMRKFAGSYPDPDCAAAAAQIPWGHNMLLFDKVDDPSIRLWYVQQAIEGRYCPSLIC